MFRRTKSRKLSHISELRQILLNKAFVQKREHSKLKKSILKYKLPWWFKIVAYILSYAFVSISLAFIVIKGIEFGNEKVAKWITSLLVTFVSSIILVEPFKVSIDLYKSFL
jgi:hypothetical protein